MNESNLPFKPPNIQAELAKERNRAAAERTLMAWVRTSLSLIGFGFGIASIVSSILNFQFISENIGNVNRVRASGIFGLAFIGLGVYALVAATIEHRHELERIKSNADYFFRPRHSIGITVATSLICIGLAAFMSILWKTVT